jgi:hypothetical protein
MARLKDAQEKLSEREAKLRLARKAQEEADADLQKLKARAHRESERAGRRLEDLQERFPAMAAGRR